MAGKIVELTDQSFKVEIEDHKGVALVDFWAPWCGPCLAIAPVVEELASQYSGKLKVGKVNVDDCNELASRFGIRSIPTMLVFKDGRQSGMLIGANAKQLRSIISEAVA